MVHLLSWCLCMTSDIFLTKKMSGVDSLFPEPHLSYSAQLSPHHWIDTQSMGHSGHCGGQSARTVSAWLHTFVGKWPVFGHVKPNSRLSLFFVTHWFHWHHFYCYCSIQSFSHPPTLYCFNIFLPQALQRHNYARCCLKNRNLLLLWRWKNLCTQKKPDSSSWRWKGVACFCSTPISKIKLETDYLRWKCQFSFWPQNIWECKEGFQFK